MFAPWCWRHPQLWALTSSGASPTSERHVVTWHGALICMHVTLAICGNKVPTPLWNWDQCGKVVQVDERWGGWHIMP